VSGPSRTASRTGKRPPTGGHHVRSKSTSPRSEQSERREAKRPRGAKEDPPPGVTTCGRSLRAPGASKASGAKESGRGGPRKTPHRGSPRAVEVYEPQERAKRAARRKAAAGGQGRPPTGGHHVRSKSTSPRSEQSERRQGERPRGANEDHPTPAATWGRAVRPPAASTPSR